MTQENDTEAFLRRIIAQQAATIELLARRVELAWRMLQLHEEQLAEIELRIRRLEQLAAKPARVEFSEN